MEPYLASVILFAGNFAPRGWAFCQGQLLPISSNQALYSLLGTTYGGDGRTTFALPDFRGRVPVHAGTGPGLPTYRLGQKGGEETHTLSANEMPNHNHPAPKITSNSPIDSEDPTANTRLASNQAIYATGATASLIGEANTGNAGGGQSHNNMQPSLTLHYIICTAGLFPSRN